MPERRLPESWIDLSDFGRDREVIRDMTLMNTLRQGEFPNLEVNSEVMNKPTN